MAQSKPGSLIGIDVGGTFTDCVLVDSQGKSTVEKTFTTPEDPSKGVMNGLEKFADKAGLSVATFLPALSASFMARRSQPTRCLQGAAPKPVFSRPRDSAMFC